MAAVMNVAAALFGVELADIAKHDVGRMEAAIMTAIQGQARHAGPRSLCLHYCFFLLRHW